MKFICTQENLVRGLGRVVPVAGRNTQLPILGHVLLQLRDGLLHLTATDLEIGIHTTVPGKVEHDGECTVAARKFMDYVQQLPTHHPLLLEQKKAPHVTLSTEGFRAKFIGGAADDFPLLPSLSSEVKTIVVAGDAFCRVLTRTLFAAARDDTRPEIHSVYVQSEAGVVVVAATDSFRLSEDRIARNGSDDSFSFLLPLATGQEVVRLFSDTEELTMSVQDNHIVFVGDGTELSSRLVDGTYPDYRQIIPTSSTITGTLDKEELVRALKTLAVFLPRDSHRVRLIIRPQEGVVALTTGGEAGEGDVELSFEGTGDDLEVLFNIQYLLDGLHYLTGERVRLQLVGSTEPAVFRADGDESYLYVVMPIQAQ